MDNETKEMRTITAQEARAKAEQSKFLLRFAYKAISESANRNECRTRLNIKDIDEKAILNLKNTLNTAGFKVCNDGYTTLMIEW